MEILFENSYTRNKQLAKEIYCYIYFTRKSIAIPFALLLISFISNILFGVLYNSFSMVVLIIVPLFFLFQFYLYFHHVNAMIKRDIEVHGKGISVETIVTDEFIQNTASTGAVNKLEYDKIKKVIQTKNLILIWSKANLIYIFRKDAFTKGTEAEFIMFLKDKGVKIK